MPRDSAHNEAMTRLWIQGGMKDQSQESHPPHIHTNHNRTNYQYSTVIVFIYFLMQWRIEGFFYTGISYAFYNLRSTNSSLRT